MLSWKAHNAHTVHIEPGIGDGWSEWISPGNSGTIDHVCCNRNGTWGNRQSTSRRHGWTFTAGADDYADSQTPDDQVGRGYPARMDNTECSDSPYRRDRRGRNEWKSKREASQIGFNCADGQGTGGNQEKKIPFVVADGNAIKIKTMECKSRDSRLTTCDFRRTVSENERILGVVFWRQNGRSSPCIEGGTYRIDLEKGIIGVTQGCDADFRVFYRAQ